MHAFFHRYRRRRAFWVFTWLAWAMVSVAPAWSADVHAAPGPGVHRMHVQHASTHTASSAAGGCNDHDGNCCHGPGQACHCTPACTSVLPASALALGDTPATTVTIFAAGVRAAPQAGYGPPLRPPAA